MPDAYEDTYGTPVLDPWVAAGDLSCSPCTLDPDVVARAATIIADNLSGNVYGLRELRLRPQSLLPSCGCRIGCGCGRATQVLLALPVVTIDSVKVDGVLLDAADWTLYRDNRLVRNDDGTFPCCQRLELDPDADVGTLEIAGTFGEAPDEMAILADQEIACEIVKAFDDPASCSLPKHAQSFTRQQLSVNFSNPTTEYIQGFIGLPITGMWLAALDAAARRRPGRAVDLAEQAAWRAPVAGP